MANQHDNQPRQSNIALGVRAVVLLYVLYLAFDIAAAYVRGDSDALNLPLTILFTGILVVLSLVLLVLTYRQWKVQSAQSDHTEESDTSDGDIL